MVHCSFFFGFYGVPLLLLSSSFVFFVFSFSSSPSSSSFFFCCWATTTNPDEQRRLDVGHGVGGEEAQPLLVGVRRQAGGQHGARDIVHVVGVLELRCAVAPDGVGLRVDARPRRIRVAEGHKISALRHTSHQLGARQLLQAVDVQDGRQSAGRTARHHNFLQRAHVGPCQRVPHRHLHVGSTPKI